MLYGTSLTGDITTTVWAVEDCLERGQLCPGRWRKPHSGPDRWRGQKGPWYYG